MTLYKYKAIRKDGTLCKGSFVAQNVHEFKNHLHESGLSLISASKKINFMVPRKVKSQLLIELCFHLEQFELAGIPLLESLETFLKSQNSSKLKTMLTEIIEDVEGGLLFSEALEKHPSVFDPVFRSLIIVGEKTGELSLVLHQIYKHLKWKEKIQGQTIKAFRYPLIIALLLFALICILMATLVPELLVFIKNFGGELPTSTFFFISFSNFLSNHFNCILFTFVVTIPSLILFVRFHPKGLIWKDYFLDRLPILRGLYFKSNLTRFCHVFSVLFGNEVDILQALKIAKGPIKHRRLYLSLERVESLIKEGYLLSEAFQYVGIFPSILIRMVSIGEKTSSLQKTLLQVTNYFNTSLKRQVDHLLGLIEPFMVLSIGLALVGIIYSFILPLYNAFTILDY